MLSINESVKNKKHKRHKNTKRSKTLKTSFANTFSYISTRWKLETILTPYTTARISC